MKITLKTYILSAINTWLIFTLILVYYVIKSSLIFQELGYLNTFEFIAILIMTALCLWCFRQWEIEYYQSLTNYIQKQGEATSVKHDNN